MPGLDTKMTLTLKDLIMLIGFLGAGFGAYYSVTSEIEQLKTKVTDLTEANTAYVGLPADVETLTEDMKKYGALTETIYYGLLSEGIIKPPQ